MNKNLETFNYCDKNYFSTNFKYEYSWEINGGTDWLVWDYENNKGYIFHPDNSNESIIYKDIYDALEHITYNGKSLKELLLESDLFKTFKVS